MIRAFTFLIGLLIIGQVHACSCVGAVDFCSSLDTVWSEPDIIVLAEKLSDIHYGMKVVVIDPLAGSSTAGDTLMVWGDHGSLCRVYTGNWSIGDTIVLALHYTDFMGNTFPNTSFPPDLEQDGDFHISICGVYYLTYQNGVVSGAIDNVVNSMAYVDFQSMVNDCFLATGIEENDVPELIVRQDPYSGELIIGTGSFDSYIEIFDLQGRLIGSINANEPQVHFNTSDFPKGALIVRVFSNDMVRTQKVLIL